MNYDIEKGIEMLRFISEQSDEWVFFPYLINKPYKSRPWFKCGDKQYTRTFSKWKQPDPESKISDENDKDLSLLRLVWDDRYVQIKSHREYRETCIVKEARIVEREDDGSYQFGRIKMTMDDNAPPSFRCIGWLARITAKGAKFLRDSTPADHGANWKTPENRQKLFSQQRSLLDPDKATCPDCGFDYLDKDLVWSRKKPGKLGGKYEEGNVELACYNCNLKKGPKWE